ncbi:ABC transporter ATP-binding protein [Cellulosilyticum sp. WCF-2]|uniref:ABC transporter ATP-binding protein n=1 Tax=Cellulosilyticum sp. WCF-2 TaxID=2497860 RepID=UPI000F8D0F8C|nr:ABC transporter ATP-binding protein [Cellulosilyticum sp. WCF-2]QEH66979.1 ABC transporter ATP-binding protein [Cellulosilyticum sp. WCF-2]
MDNIISIKNVSKMFRIYSDRPETMKEKIVKKKKRNYKEFYALRNVSFDVKKGSTVGFIGQNGCGKSTMLKIINRTMFPNEGEVTIKGKVSSLIELGAGFHPELTGRENIYTNATIFGLNKEEVEKRLPQIIEFSELGEFIDNPVRTYSSGMYARLAFSVAIHVDAEILLVDEILGVGDMNFQAKCAAKIYDLKMSGVTIILVTHDMATIDKLCDYAIWFDHGSIVTQGESRKVERNYLEFMAETRFANEINKDAYENKEDDEKNESLLAEEQIKHLGVHHGTGELVFTSIKLLNKDGEDKRTFCTGEKMTLVATYKCRDGYDKLFPNIGFEISKLGEAHIYGTNTAREGFKKIPLKQQGVIEIEIEKLQLLSGEYAIGIAVDSIDEKTSYDHYFDIAHFKMYSEIPDIGIYRMPHKFKIDNQEVSLDLGNKNKL